MAGASTPGEKGELWEGSGVPGDCSGSPWGNRSPAVGAVQGDVSSHRPSSMGCSVLGGQMMVLTWMPLSPLP